MQYCIEFESLPLSHLNLCWPCLIVGVSVFAGRQLSISSLKHRSAQIFHLFKFSCMEARLLWELLDCRLACLELKQQTKM